MKIEIEIRSTMSRRETFQALRIVSESSARLAHRMTDAQLDRIAQVGAELMEIVNTEYARRAPEGRALIEAAPAYEQNRIAAYPSAYGE